MQQGKVGGTHNRRLHASGAFALVVAVALAIVSAESRGQSISKAAEHQVKAAFLLKFASYVEWPPQSFASAESPLEIGVVGADELAGELAGMVEGRSVNGRPVIVRKLRRGGLALVNILYVGRSEGQHAAESIAAVRGQPVLVVTDSEAAFEHGATIKFVVVGDKVRFDVAPPSSEVGNLKISARLLSVARKVVTGPPS
jgi:hypothetical protein